MDRGYPQRFRLRKAIVLLAFHVMLFTCTYICGPDLILLSMLAPRYFVFCFCGSLRMLAVFGITGLTCGSICGEATITSHLFWSREGLFTPPSTTLYESNHFNILSIYFPVDHYFIRTRIRS